MFAIIAASGRQLRVSPNEVVRIDFEGDENLTNLNFDQVLLANNDGASVIGRPVIDGAVVTAEVINREEKGPKIEIGKMRRRKNFRKHTGHRQKYSAVRITAINIPGLGNFDAASFAPSESEQVEESDSDE